MDNNYTIRFQNNSSHEGSFILFQQDPGIGVADAFPLAWFATSTYPKTTARFTWQINYNFVWEETGELIPGVVFSATQSPSVDLSISNQVTLTYDAKNQACAFVAQKAGPRPDILYINQDSSVPMKQVAVGIGMSGAGAFVVQAQPNQNLKFTPHPRYYVAFGDYQAGQVLDIQEMTNVAEVAFPPGVYTMTAILERDKTWLISSAKERNSALVGARRHFPELFSRQEPGGLQANATLSPTTTKTSREPPR